MIIKSIKQNKKDYTVTIDDFEVSLSEDVIVKYNLYANKEIDEKLYYEISLSEEYSLIYNQALNYSIKYNKSMRAVYEYLCNKNYPPHICQEVTNELVSKGIINDFKIAAGLTTSYFKRGNGRHLINAKLESMLLSKESIIEAINKIDMEEYIEAMIKYAQKYYDKNHKLDKYTRLMKTKDYLKKHGYTYDEIARLEINES